MEVKRFINELMSSNCYIIYDNKYSDCIIVDPASRDSLKEINFCTENGIIPSYIILTHEHTDHTWGVNSLIEKYPDLKVLCHARCASELDRQTRAYFLLYYSDTSYVYRVKRVDIQIEGNEYTKPWHDNNIFFIYTPGHSIGSMCIKIDRYLFTGDTYMPEYKSTIDKKKCSLEMYDDSMSVLKSAFDLDKVAICPGHGNFYNI
jgi:glyoxylase-like metal-dependent hydrolase (beta-lactamase superfamily II)